jgi:hypothetical protein
MVATFISVYLNLPVYDSQCGAKFFDNKLAIEIFQEPFVSKWLFDVEIFKRMKMNGKTMHDCCMELPLNVWIEKGKSKLNLREIIRLPFEAWRIMKNYKKIKLPVKPILPVSENVLHKDSLLKTP